MAASSRDSPEEITGPFTHLSIGQTEEIFSF